MSSFNSPQKPKKCQNEWRKTKGEQAITAGSWCWGSSDVFLSEALRKVQERFGKKHVVPHQKIKSCRANMVSPIPFYSEPQRFRNRSGTVPEWLVFPNGPWKKKFYKKSQVRAKWCSTSRFLWSPWTFKNIELEKDPSQTQICAWFRPGAKGKVNNFENVWNY